MTRRLLMFAGWPLVAASLLMVAAVVLLAMWPATLTGGEPL